MLSHHSSRKTSSESYFFLLQNEDPMPCWGCFQRLPKKRNKTSFQKNKIHKKNITTKAINIGACPKSPRLKKWWCFPVGGFNPFDTNSSNWIIASIFGLKISDMCWTTTHFKYPTPPFGELGPWARLIRDKKKTFDDVWSLILRRWRQKILVQIMAMSGLGWWFGFLGSPCERDCYLGVSLESHTTNPNHQFLISWLVEILKNSGGFKNGIPISRVTSCFWKKTRVNNLYNLG